jgi:hypothetical protein
MYTLLFIHVGVLQKAQEMAEQGIFGPEAHEMCRPEEVRSMNFSFAII